MAPAIRERRAESELPAVVLVVAVLGHTGLELALHAREILIEHEIHDTRQRVRAVGGGCAAGHDVHALDQRIRERIDVWGAAARGQRRVDVALPVEKNKRAIGAHAAKIELADAGRARRQIAIRRAWVHRSSKSRKDVHRIRDVDRVERVEFFRAEHGDGGRSFVTIAHNARTCDDDLVERCGRCGVLRVCNGGGKAHQRGGADRGTGHGFKTTRQNKLSNRHKYLPLMSGKAPA